LVEFTADGFLKLGLHMINQTIKPSNVARERFQVNYGTDEARFQLPFKVQHQLPTKSEDCLFHGIKTETKQKFLLIGDMVDGYSPMKGSQVLLLLLCVPSGLLLLFLAELSLHMMKMKRSRPPPAASLAVLPRRLGSKNRLHWPFELDLIP
jgi:hypothetical protein